MKPRTTGCLNNFFDLENFSSTENLTGDLKNLLLSFYYKDIFSSVNLLLITNFFYQNEPSITQGQEHMNSFFLKKITGFIKSQSSHGTGQSLPFRVCR
jgi:hypothetical protein